MLTVLAQCCGLWQHAGLRRPGKKRERLKQLECRLESFYLQQTLALDRMSVESVYRELREKSSVVMEALLADPESLTEFAKAHNLLSDYGALKSALEGRYEAKLVDLAIKEYEFALFAVSMGNYRGAFSALRLSFEMNIAAIYFSAHEVDYRLWVKKARDINWGVLLNPDNGVFSPTFSIAFNAELNDERNHYQALAMTVYRECSEYVHGNAHTHENLPSSIEYDKNVVSIWCQMATTMQLVVIFAFALRYIKQMKQPELGFLEPVVLETLGHLPSIQLVFGAAA